MAQRIGQQQSRPPPQPARLGAYSAQTAVHQQQPIASHPQPIDEDDDAYEVNLFNKIY